MREKRTRHPLGGGADLYRHVTGAANDVETARRLKEIRNTLLAARVSAAAAGGHVIRAPIRRRTGLRLTEKTTTDMSSTGDVSGLFRNAPFGVNRKKLGHGASRSRSRLEAIRATKCDRWQFDVELAHACDVLGPNSCSDCIRERMRRQIYDDADRTFPGISVSERDLCTTRSDFGLQTTTTLEIRPTNRLPPIKEASQGGYRPPPPSSTTRSRTVNIRDSKTLQEIRKRAAKNGLLPITSTELQNRVLRRHRRRQKEPSLSVDSFPTLYSPVINRDDTDLTTEPTPTISVEIKFPTIRYDHESSLSPM